MSFASKFVSDFGVNPPVKSVLNLETHQSLKHGSFHNLIVRLAELALRITSEYLDPRSEIGLIESSYNARGSAAEAVVVGAVDLN